MTYKHPDGNARNFSIFCGPLYNAVQKVEKIVTVWADITRRKKVEKELLERFQLEKTLSSVTQEFLVSTTVENALRGTLRSLLVFSDASRVCWFEPSADKTSAECTLVTSRMAEEEAHDYFIKKMNFAGALATWKQMLETQQILQVGIDVKENEIHNFLDFQKIHHFLAIPIFVEGRMTGFVRLDYSKETHAEVSDLIKPIKMICATLQENLQRWKIQEELQLLNTAVQTTTDSIVISRINPPTPISEIVFVNSAACQMSGYTREELIGGRLANIFTGAKNDPELETKILAAMSTKAHYHAEVFQKRKDGHEYLAELEVAPICDSEGNVTYSVLTQKDITAKRDLETRSSLSSKLESIGQLAAGVAHEINTPAQFISDNLYFIKENWETLSRAIDKYIDIQVQQENPRLAHVIREMPGAIADTIEGVKRISTIVQAMREFAHSSSEKTRADINNAISTTIIVGRNEWKYCAEIKTELAADMPLVLCHIGDINQVILNLIVNSAHAIAEKFPAGERGHITVRTMHNSTHAIIEVQDDGSGIPENIRQKIFDPFFTTKPQGKGTGQGLYITHRIIVDKHQGTIEVESNPGQGTKFIIKLPLE